jgi:hypothetical protein
MTPELARRLARAYESLSTLTTGVADVEGVAGVAAVARYAPKPQQLRQLPPLQAKSYKGEREGGAPVAAALDAVANAIEERRAIIAETCPAPYVDAFARLDHQKPISVSDSEWRQALDDAGRFLDAWGTLAVELQSTAGVLFDVPREGRLGGLVWQLGGESVASLGEVHACLTEGRTPRRA